MATAIGNLHNPTPVFGYKGDDLEDDLVGVDQNILRQLNDSNIASMRTAPQVKEAVTELAPKVFAQLATYWLLSCVYTYAILACLNSPLLTYGVTATASIATNNLIQKLPDVSGAIGTAAGAATQGMVNTAYHTYAVYNMSQESLNLASVDSFPQAFIATM